MEYLEFLIALIFYIAKELKIAPHISIIVNSSLASAIFPDDWNSITKTRGKKSPGILLRNCIATLINETGHLFSPN